MDYSTLDLIAHAVSSGYGGSDSAFVLGAASTGFGLPARAVPAAMDGETVDYFAFYSTTEYEIGFGAYTHSGTTIGRSDANVRLSSNSNNRVAFSGAPTVAVQPFNGRLLELLDTLLDLGTGTAAGARAALGANDPDNLDFTAGTDIGEALADGDEVIVGNASDSQASKVAALSRLKSFIGMATSNKTVTTANVTDAAWGNFYILTVSGLTAQRNFVIPAGTNDGDLIGFILDTNAPTTITYELCPVGDTGVVLLQGATESTATVNNEYRYFIKGEYAVFRWDATNSMAILVADGRIKQTAGVELSTATTDTPSTSGSYVEFEFDTILWNVGGVVVTTGDVKNFTVRRDGKYTVTGRTPIASLTNNARVISKVEVDDGVSPVRACTGSTVYNYTGATAVVPSFIAGVADADLNDDLRLYVYQDSGSAMNMYGSTGQASFTMEEQL